ncbi:tellurite resistance protein TerA [Roseimicrobium gellanilyticum]|uniref:Tellurite resistance protein TerA n=1 Tax=Roseimicrobium gellanilyticum TaxID=748857 RepID=A0A366HQ56_9BACT|nr:TerD family protein [Roseimicrobium gellanilyticum]RBP44600.1 tellurite resistance protein TerA [Roseimicrobium gellanilyticum]
MKTLARGQKATISSLGGNPAALEVAVSLDLSQAGDVDVSCFGLDEQGKLSDERYFIFYNQPKSPCGALQAKGASGDARQTFQVDLGKLPSTVKRLVFTAAIDGSATMNQITRGAVRLKSAGSPMAEFPLEARDYGAEKALMLLDLYWKDEWRVAATGQGFAGGLDALLRHFGGKVAEDEQKPKPPVASPPPAPAPPPRPATPPPVAAAAAASAAPTLSLKKLTLEKPGERKSINLTKGGGQSPIHINLNWDRATKRSFFGGKQEADLDLGCFFQLRDGRKSCIQALGGNFGSRSSEPFIYLDKDDRSGASTDGENLYILRPDIIERVLVFAFIYEGVANFSTVNGRLNLRETDGSETLIRLDAPQQGATFCAICLISRTSSGVDVMKETRYFRGHPDADRHYGFGFQWRQGSK